MGFDACGYLFYGTPLGEDIHNVIPCPYDEETQEEETEFWYDSPEDAINQYLQNTQYEILCTGPHHAYTYWLVLKASIISNTSFNPIELGKSVDVLDTLNLDQFAWLKNPDMGWQVRGRYF